MIRVLFIHVELAYLRVLNWLSDVKIARLNRQTAKLVAERDESRAELIRLGGARWVIEQDEKMDKAA